MTNQTHKPKTSGKTKQAINWIPMPCMNCHKVKKMPEYSIYCLECQGRNIDGTQTGRKLI